MNASTTVAWREILERVFEGFEAHDNVAPSWMTNPRTGRRLKLDRYFPELGIAIRFVGLQGRQGHRPSDEEAEDEADRNIMRDWLCRQQGVTLVQIDPDAPDPRQIVARLRSALSRTARLLAQSADVPPATKAALAPRIVRAQRACEQIMARLRRPEDLLKYADLWHDRQYARLASAGAQANAGASGRRRSYRVGMAVRHVTLGDGVVKAVQPDENDIIVVVQFNNGALKKFLSSLVWDKLTPLKDV